MSNKIIILKNAIEENIVISSLGLRIEPNESSSVDYENILALEDSSELSGYINTNSIVVNDGTNDLATLSAIEYLQINSGLGDIYYDKTETDDIANNINSTVDDLNDRLSDSYYTASEVNQKIGELSSSGIKGAVDYKDNLPEDGNSDGDIYIVRSSIGTGSDPTRVVPDGQTALYLSFDQSTDDVLGHDGQIHGNVDIVGGGKIGNCAQFSDEGYLEYYSDSSFGEGPTLTFGGWIKTSQTGNFGLMGRWSDEGDGQGWRLDVHGNKLRISFDTWTWCGLSFTSPNNLPLDQWVHVAIVYNGQNLIMYINGVAVNSVVIEGEQIDSWDKSVIIGAPIDCSGSDYFEGFMEDIFIENRAMSHEEIESLIFTSVTDYDDEGFYKWENSEWNFLSRNTGESGETISHEKLLNLNSGEYQHLTVEQKDGLVSGEDTELHSHHTHYYTKEEIDLNNAKMEHGHDELYYGKTEVDSLLNTIDFNKVSSNDSSTNVTGSELEVLTNGSNADSLHTHKNIGVSGSGGLDEAYDNNSEWNQGQGRTITIDAGPIQLTASNGFAPIRLTEINDAPTQWLGGGEMCYSNGELYIYDSGRSKWLAASSLATTFGRSGNDRTGYMRFCGEIQTGSGYGGFVAPWKGTIVGISCCAKNEPGGSFEIGVGGEGWDPFYWGGQSETSWDNINIDFDASERVTVWQDSDSDKPDYPTYTLFIKRRL